MINPRNSMIGLLLLSAALSLPAQPKLIFDTDFGGDADDLGALAMLHHFVEKGECELLAIMCWNVDPYAVPALDAVNRFYGHPDIPIGTREEEASVTDWMHAKPIADHFPNELSSETVEESTALYRKLLAGSEDREVVIVTVGPLSNIQRLIDSGPGEHSDLTGKELLHKKVKQFVIMGGQFPEGDNEWNFNGDMPGVTKYVLDHLDLPVVFSGFELGDAIKSGEVFNDMDPNTPLYVGFKHFSEHAPWIKENYKGRILDNSTFDQTAVLYAVRGGTGTWWEEVTGGRCEADDTGGNTWIAGEGKDHTYLVLREDPEKMAALIESFMLGEF